MAELMLLYLDAPLQSWGLRARWDVRDTGSEPSKSGIVGLLGCALGYPSGDPRLKELDEQLSMGVRVERPGTVLVDYQTVTGVMRTADGGVKGNPDDPNTIVSPRAYLHDAAYLVAVQGPSELLERCVRALQNPKWPIYLGRKACVPSRPVFQKLTNEYATIEDALRRYKWEQRFEGETTPEKLRCVIEDVNGNRFRPDRYTGNPARMYDQRAVRVQWVSFPGVKEDAPCT